MIARVRARAARGRESQPPRRALRLAEAAAAITDANLDLKSQVAKEVVAFVVETVDQPQACIPLVQSALHHRVGINDVAVQPVIKDIDAGVLAASDVEAMRAAERRVR